MHAEPAGEHDVVFARGVEVAEVEVAPHRFENPVVPHPLGQVGIHHVASGLAHITLEAGHVLPLQDAEREAEMVDLVTQGSRLELIDDRVALELARRLQGQIEDQARGLELIRRQLAFAGDRFHRRTLINFDQ